MRLRNLVAFAIAVLVALPVAAQEQTGAIQGVVRDSQGGAVPGATVEASNGRGQTVSADHGRHRDVPLPGAAPEAPTR